MASEFERLNQTNEEGDIISPDDFDDARYPRPDHTEYNIARLSSDMTAGFSEPGPKTSERADEQGGETLTRATRLLLVKDHLGFYPQQPEELNQVTALLSDAYAGSPARYLNDILLHQKKHEEAHKNDEKTYEPDRALKKIVSNWIGYLDESQKENGMLALFLKGVKESGAQASTPLNRLSQVQDWQHEGSLRRVVAAMTREFETDEFAAKDGAITDHLGDPYLSQDKDVVAREQHFFDKLKVGSASEIGESLITANQKRAQFWLKQLDGTEKHLSVRPLILSSDVVQQARAREVSQRLLGNEGA